MLLEKLFADRFAQLRVATDLKLKHTHTHTHTNTDLKFKHTHTHTHTHTHNLQSTMKVQSACNKSLSNCCFVQGARPQVAFSNSRRTVPVGFQGPSWFVRPQMAIMLMGFSTELGVNVITRSFYTKELYSGVGGTWSLVALESPGGNPAGVQLSHLYTEDFGQV